MPFHIIPIVITLHQGIKDILSYYQEDVTSGTEKEYFLDLFIKYVIKDATPYVSIQKIISHCSICTAYFDIDNTFSSLVIW